MMNKFIVTLVSTLFLFSASVMAQPQNWNWYFGDGAAVNFSTGSPVAVTGCAMSTVEGCASISDASGNLLFYTDGINVWNRNNIAMPNGLLLNGNSSSTQSGVIVKVPCSNHLYYIFTSDYEANPHGVCYSMVDMLLDGGLGDVSCKNIQLITPACEKLCAVRNANGTDFWVVCHGFNNNTFYSYPVTCNGVGAPIISNTGTVITSSVSTIGYLKASPNAQKIAAAVFEGEFVDLCDFNNTTGVVSNAISMPMPSGNFTYGVCFSPNNTVLYTIGDGGAPPLWQYDISSNNLATIMASQYTVTTLSTSGGAIQMGPDGKMYVCNYSSSVLNVINNPNTLGVGCNYVAGAVNLGTGTCMIGLPNMLDILTNQTSISDLPEDTSVCTTPLILDAGSGATSYLWSTGATTETISVNSAGPYSVIIINTNPCGADTLHDTCNVHIVPPIVVNLGNDTTLCTGQNLTLNAANAGAVYNWSTGATTQTINVDTTATYYVTVSAGSCVETDSITVTFHGATVNLGHDTTICAGNPITLNAGNPGATYLWSTGANTQTIIADSTATYYVSVSVGNCVATDSIIVDFLANVTVNLGNDTTLCIGQSLTLNAGNVGATYSWSNGLNTQTITVSSSGTYTVTATAGICSGTGTITVNFVASPTVNLGNNISVCLGIPVTIDAGNAGSTYLWSNGAVTETISPVVSGIYTVTVSIGTCTATGSISVSFTALPVVNLGPDQYLCSQSTILDAGNAGATYLWSNGQITETISVNSSGTYWVQVQNGTCTGTDTVIITEGISPTVNLGPDIQLCYGETVKLDAGNAGMTYFWSNGQTTQTIIANTTSEYFVKVNDHGCSTLDSVNVFIANQIQVSLGADTFLCPGSQLFIDAGIGFNSYTWTPSGGNDHFMITYEPGTYTVLVTDGNGCTATSQKWVRDFCQSNLYIPSSFTPNNNGINDVFMAYSDGVVDFHMYIFDRWGETLFESSDISQGWDGTYNGNVIPQGSYIYRVDYSYYTFLELQKRSQYGIVTLIR